MISIRKTRIEEIDCLMDIFEQGKRIMRKSGNKKQWTGGYPTKELIQKDIEAGNSYVCLNEQECIIGTFTFIAGKDPTYARIYEGQWLDDEQPYATIHRLASTEDSHGVAAGTCGQTLTATTTSCNTSCRSTGSATAASSTC